MYGRLSRQQRKDKKNIYVHIIVFLDARLKKLKPEDDIELAIYDENFDIDHIDGSRYNISVNNLQDITSSKNQAKKISRERLTEDQKAALDQLLVCFTDLKPKLLSAAVGRSKNEIGSILYKDEMFCDLMDC